MRTLFCVVLVGVVLAACGAGLAGDATTTSTAVPTTVVEVTTTPAGGPTIEPGLNSRVAIAVADLSGRIGVSESEIEVISAQPVVWPDASLGCPQPGMQYAQVATDGALIELGSQGTTYSYHMGGSTYEPFLCESPSGTIPPKDTTGTTITRDDLKPDPTDQSVPPPRYDD